jgi:peptide/nickel transport system permease protein
MKTERTDMERNQTASNDTVSVESPQRPSRPKRGRKKLDVATASTTQLIWLNFKKHKLAFGSLIVLIIIYVVTIFANFFAPYDPLNYAAQRKFQPPQRPRFISTEGFHLRPFVYGFNVTRNPETLGLEFEVDTSERYPIYFFVRGDSYDFLGLFEGSIHLFGTKEGHIYLFGGDSLGRDVLSRILYGGRISTSIGFIGVIISLTLGLTIGGVAGLIGGWADNLIQRFMELIRSLPNIPLWMGLSAAIPMTWSPVQVYIGIVVILSLIDWTNLGRVVRSKFLSLRSENFVQLARLSGASNGRLIFKHMVPAFTSHIVASVTLAIPRMILAETSLSFLGIGLRPPTISWGVLMQSAQSIRAVSRAPWLLLPGVAVIITVLAFNFVGDGVRDAADPYSH